MKIRAIFAIGCAALTFSVADALSAHDGKAQTVSTGFSIVGAEVCANAAVILNFRQYCVDTIFFS